QSFRPEFLNRVDDIIVFDPLEKEQLAQIVDIQLGRLRKRLAERHMTLDVSKAALGHLAQVGYDPDFGARPLKRAITNQLENPLAIALLEGQFHDGETLVVDFKNDVLTFKAKGKAK
ncbi:MAG: hypothetical protein AAB066_04290, partial [Candidatus Margulisiibacteriota bacterium]